LNDLKELGKSLHVVQNRIIVRGEPVGSGNSKFYPPNNAVVTDQKRTKIGKIFDAFGPVKRPYFIVKPNKGLDAKAHVGKKLYVEETSRRDCKW
jgi:RNA-binding protein